MARYGISTYGSSTGLDAGDIKNQALFLLGFVDEIDFNDTTLPIVNKVNTVYSTLFLGVLANYPWRFALKRQQLTTRADASDNFKYKYNFVLPISLLSVKRPYSDPGYLNPIEKYETTPTNINTDSTTCYLQYIAIVDEEDLPQYFIDYFKYKLAMELCFNLTGDSELLQLLAAQEQRALTTAKNIDAKQNETRVVRSSPFTMIRG
jgi:hypothetical protein